MNKEFFNVPQVRPNEPTMGVKYYVIDLYNLQQLMKYVNGVDFKRIVKESVFGEAGKYVLGFMYFPFDLRGWFYDIERPQTNYAQFEHDFNIKHAETPIKYSNTNMGEDTFAPKGYYLNNQRNFPYIINFAKDLTIERKYYNFLDYPPYTNAQIYLPYVGLKDLNLYELVGESFDIQYCIDLTTGTSICAIIRQSDGAFIQTFECQLGFSIPFAYDSIMPELKKIAGTALKVGVGVATSAVGGMAVASANAGAKAGVASTVVTSQKVSGAGKANFNKASIRNDGNVTSSRTVSQSNTQTPVVPRVDYSKQQLIQSLGETTLQAFDSSIGYIARYENGKDITNRYNYPYARIIITRPTLINVENYNHIVGKPSSYTAILGNLKGFTQVGSIHLENFYNCTESEVSEIDSLLREGVIM